MNKILRSGSFCCLLLLALAGSSSQTAAAQSAAKSKGAAKPAPAKPASAKADGLDFATWVPTDLSKYDPEIKVIIALPKNAKIEKGLMAGLDVTLDKNYVLNIYNGSYESVTYDKENLANKEVYTVGKILKEEPNGLIFTSQFKQIEGFDPYETESHFVYYIGDPNTALFKIKDDRPFACTTPEEFYTEANATKLYNQVKATAKLK